MRRRCGDILCPALAPDFGDAKKGAPWKAPTAKGNAHCLRSLSKSFRGIQRPRPHGMRPTPFPGCATAMAVSGAKRQGSPPMRLTPSRPRDSRGGGQRRRAGQVAHALTPSRPRDSRGGGHYRKARQLAHAPYPFPAAQRQRRRAVPKSRLSARAPYSFLAAQQQRRRAVPKGEVGRPCALSLPCRAVAKAEGVTEGLLLARVRFQEGLFARRYPFATGGSRLESGGDAFFVPAAYSRRQRPPISTFYRFGGPRRPFPSNQACTDAPRTIAGAVRGMSEARASPPVSPRPFGCSLFRGCR